MKSLFSFVKPQIAFGAGGRGGGSSKGSAGIKPTGFADQASRMANSQRQLGAPQFPGFNLEADKDVPSVAKRKPTKDRSPIDTGTGGFMGGFNKSPKPTAGSDPNPFQSAFGGVDSEPKKGRLDLSGIGGTNPVEAPKPSMPSMPSMPDRGTAPDPGTAPVMGDPGMGMRPPRKQPKTQFDPDRRRPMPGMIADDFIPRNPDGSPKYTTPDGRPSRGPSFEMPVTPRPNPGGGKGGGGIARPPKRKPVAGPTPMPTRPRPTPPTPGPDMPTPFPDPIMRPMPTPFPDPRPKRPSTPISDPRIPTRPERPTTPAKRPIIGKDVMRPGPTIPGDVKGGGGPRPMPPRQPSIPVTPRPLPQPIGGGTTRPGIQRPTRPSTPLPPEVIRDVGRMPVPVPYGGKGGGARPPVQQPRQPQPFSYYRPRR